MRGTKEVSIEAKVDVGLDLHLHHLPHVSISSSILFMCMCFNLCLLLYPCLGLYTLSHLYLVEGDIWGFVSEAGGAFSLVSCSPAQTHTQPTPHLN